LEESGEVAGFVLAGGLSTRMGRDKALVELGGQPLIARGLETLRGAGLDPAIAGAQGPLERFARVVPDETSGQGPLGGVCAGLGSTRADRAVFLSVDLPLIPASLIGYLLYHSIVSGRLVTLASVNCFAQTFPVVLRREALPVLSAELGAGRGGCLAAFRQAAEAVHEEVSVLPAEMLVQAGQVADPKGLPPARWFLNVNSPEELERAGSLVQTRA
jgi:molybdopterin-guanine dinucleotide biosynthesis protein A